MIMKELYAQLGISSAVYDFGKSVEDSLKERFEKFDKINITIAKRNIPYFADNGILHMGSYKVLLCKTILVT